MEFAFGSKPATLRDERSNVRDQFMKLTAPRRNLRDEPQGVRMIGDQRHRVLNLLECLIDLIVAEELLSAFDELIGLGNFRCDLL